jgi:hypothetical protein
MNFFKAVTVAIAINCCVLMGADFFPLRPGNTWTYREASSGQTFTVRVGDAVNTGGNVYYQLTGYVGSDLLVRIEPVYGTLVYWDAVKNQETLLTDFEQFEGGRWLAPFRPCPEQAGQTQVARGTHDGPAGPISDVLVTQYVAIGCADAGTVQEQYAEYIGMVRRVQTSIAGPRTFDLVAARVGNLTVDVAPAGRFTVSVGPPVASGNPTATFRLQVNSAAPLNLSFSSGQEYDLALIDGNGTTVWRWSADKTFVQSTHQRTVTDEWSATVEIPWPTAPGGGLLPGNYTVQATITASAATPFAATVPVTIAATQ